MPDITDAEFQEFQRLRNEVVTQQLDVVKANFRATNPHIPQDVVDNYQGSPDDFGRFGQSLVTAFPAPSAQPTPQPAPAAPVAPPPSVQPPTPPLGTGVPAGPPQPGVQQPTTPPVMAANFNTPQFTAEQLQYIQNLGLAGMPIPGAQAPVPVPIPGASSAVLNAQTADAAQAEVIRSKMERGLATVGEAQWLAQWGDKGFVAAIKGHSEKVRAVVGGNG